MKKKILSLLLAVVMMLSLGVTARAGTVTATSENETVSLTKTYTINSGTAPTETFYLIQVGSGTVTNSSATSAPDLDYTATTISGTSYNVVATVQLGGATTTTETFTIGLPSYSKVGVYTYKLQEVKGSTAGVTYYSNDLYLVVDVTNVLDSSGSPTGELQVATKYIHVGSADSTTKISTIENTYNAGSLSVTKKVTGSFGDTSTDKEFTFTVTFSAPTTGETVDWSLVAGTVAGTTVTLNLSDSNLTYTFTLADGQTATFSNLPAGVTYEVTETADSAYETTYDTNRSGTITASTTSSTTVTNKATATVDTGVILDSAPYILILIVVAAGVVVMITRKRRNEDF